MIDQLLDQIKQSTDFQVNKKILREKTQADLHFTYNSGLFKASMDLIAFVDSWDADELYLQDVYENPIKISRSEFLTLAKQHYQTAMNSWHIQYETLKQIRKV